MEESCHGGILLLDKSPGQTSFHLVALLRKKLGIQKIGHAGTLDPFATGVMVLLIGRDFTRLSDRFLLSDKEYLARVHLGVTTDTYDREGAVTAKSELMPSLEAVTQGIAAFQGEIEQIPPMYSAKKIGGKKLYELARRGKEVERAPAKVSLNIELIGYHYPYLDIRVACSKGTYIRSLAYDLGVKLGCGAHLAELQRTRSGNFRLEQCLQASQISELSSDEIRARLLKSI